MWVKPEDVRGVFLAPKAALTSGPDLRTPTKAPNPYMAVETSCVRQAQDCSILLDADGRIIAGNKTVEAATDIGRCRIVETDGTELKSGSADRP